MANRWLILFIGLALIQGFLALSPVPVLEDEWESFTRMLRNPAYRLPTTTRPRHYEVSLDSYFDTNLGIIPPFTFDGNITIFISPTAPNVTEIVLHCNYLSIDSLSVEIQDRIISNQQSYICEMPYSFLRIPLTEALEEGQEYLIRSTFRGLLQTTMRGFYRSWYNDGTTRRWMGTTQFQPGHARQAFPCYDEPGFKATFDISIIRDADFSPTISNMPIRSNQTLPNGRVRETFYTTPLTSTYLLAFIVSHYQNVASSTNPDRPFDIYARANAGSTGNFALEVGERLLEEMEAYTNFTYYDMADNMNMKQAAIPDFSAGAMENWGLLTYREANILFDPQNTNHFYRQRIANIIAHEIAHMWFGNLVTCAWWDVLWLNEGFARFYQYFLTERVLPEFGYETRFIVEQVHVSLLSDALDSAHALTDTSVNDPAAVSAHFSTITYAKGASVLRMTQYLLGRDTYEKALRNYLRERAFSVAEPQDLFLALDVAAAEDEALSAYDGITINSYMSSWSDQAGHPVLTVTVNQQTGQITVHQARFERNTGVSSINSIWQIPITWTRGGAPEFNDLKPSTILTQQVTVLNRSTTGNEWVIFNKQQSGFYRVNYDRVNWALITRALRNNNERTLIHEYNRAQIVDDVFLFARSTIMTYDRAMNILSFLQFEDAYAPWIAAVNGFNYLLRRLAHDSARLQSLRDEIIRLSEAVVNKLQFAEVPNESFLDGMQRMYVMEFLCNVGHPECIAAGLQNFQNWTSGGFVPPNMRPWVYCVGLRQGNPADFDYFWNRYLQQTVANDQVVMLQTAGCTTHQASLERFLNEILNEDEYIRPQDRATAFSSAVSGNEENTMMMFQWLRNATHIQQATIVLGSVATPINYIAPRLLNEQDIAEFQTWLDENRALIGESSYNTGINGINTARSNIAWYERRINELVTYFETGYVEEDIDPTTTTTTTTTTQQPPTQPPSTETPGPEPDSANIIGLSVVTLITTVTINFMI